MSVEQCDRSPNSDSSGSFSFCQMTESDYAKVIFCEIEDSYPVGEDISCVYQITESVIPRASDYIGLFRVGWQSASECLASHNCSDAYSAPTADGVCDCVVFRADDLPQDTTEFYQFLYLTFSDAVCGASTPFRFHISKEAESAPEPDNNTVDQPVDELLVSTLQMEKDMLHHTIQNMEVEINNLKIKNQGMSHAYNTLQEELKETVLAKKQQELSSVNELDTFTSNVVSLTEDNLELRKKLDAAEMEKDRLKKLYAELKKSSLHQYYDSRKKSMPLSHKDNRRNFDEDLGIFDEEKAVQTAFGVYPIIYNPLSCSKISSRRRSDSKGRVTKNRSPKGTVPSVDNNDTSSLNAMKDPTAKKSFSHSDATSSDDSTKSSVTDGADAKDDNTNNSELKDTMQKPLDGKSDLSIAECPDPMCKEFAAEMLRKGCDALSKWLEKTGKPIEDEDENFTQIKMLTEEYLGERINTCQKRVEELEAKYHSAVKREAEFLSEKKEWETKEAAMKAKIGDLTSRLNEAAELYKKQYLEIKVLKKQLKKHDPCSKKNRCSTSGSTSLEEMYLSKLENHLSHSEGSLNSLVDSRENQPIVSASSSDCDTGERVSRRDNELKVEEFHSPCGLPPICNKAVNIGISVNAPVLPVPNENKVGAAPCFGTGGMYSPIALPGTPGMPLTTAQSASLGSSASSGSGSTPHSATACCEITNMIKPTVRSETTDVSIISYDELEFNYLMNPFASPEKLANEPLLNHPDSVSDSGYCMPSFSCIGTYEMKESAYELPCPICDEMVTVLPDNTSSMNEHLLQIHNQQICPVCGRMFDQSLPPDYFKFHVENHFSNESIQK